MLLRVVVSFFLLGVVVANTAPYYDLENAEKLFADFIVKYNKKYENAEEHSRRFEIFKEDLKKLNEYNELYKHDNGGYFISQFSDEGPRRSCLDNSIKPNVTHYVSKEAIVNAPASLDYREQGLVTPVRNQMACGDCFVFAAIENIEGLNAHRTGNLISLSVKQGLDCAGNCEGGLAYQFMNDMASQGCMAEEDYSPYSPRKEQCQTDPSKVKVRLSGGRNIDTPDVKTLKGALYENGAPLAIGMFASPSITRYIGKNILNPSDCHNHPSDHAVLLVGYNTDPASGRSYWIIKNSWGLNHGDQGYFYMDMQAQCSVGQTGHTASAILA